MGWVCYRLELLELGFAVGGLGDDAYVLGESSIELNISSLR